MADTNNNDDGRQDRPGRQGGNNKGGPNGGPGGNGQNRPPQNFVSRGAMWWLLLFVMAVLLVVMVNNVQHQGKVVSWQEFKSFASPTNYYTKVTVEDEQILGEINANTPGIEKGQTRYVAKISRETKRFYVEEMSKLGVKFEESPGNPLFVMLLFNFGPIILIAFLIYFFVFRGLRGAGGGPGMLGSFGRSRHKMMTKEHSNVTLADVAGIDEAKEEVNEIIEFLKNPKKFQRLGGRVPRGVLLSGDPGCGKTLLAKAVAGEADVPFFSISGSDFVEMFVGVGASRVRDLFKQAKENSPCIIFLDEIDAVGRRRGSGFSSGGHDEREQTLNAILVEMDGFDTNDQVIVIAATNRSDVLDPALIRPGRFDRQISVPLPDLRGRIEILKVHSRRIKMGPNVDIERLARGTPMFSGADLAAIMNEAAIGATLQGKDFVEQEDLEEARDKVRWGRARKSHKIEEDERKVIAYHEAGHAIIMLLDSDSEPLHKVTIIPRGEALGVTFMLPERDRHIRTRKFLLAMLRTTFGGRIAEDMFCGDISSGAAGDIQQATNIARAMVTHYGMSEKLGFQLYGLDTSKNPWEQPDKLYSDETAKTIDEEVRTIIERTYNEAKQILETNRDKVQRLAEALLRYETLSRDEVERLMRGEDLTKPTVGDLLKAEQNKPKQGGKPTRTEPGIEPGGPGVIPSPA